MSRFFFMRFVWRQENKQAARLLPVCRLLVRVLFFIRLLFCVLQILFLYP